VAAFTLSGAIHIWLQVRTTAAVTRAAAGVADNVLPQSGSVTINFRLLPGDTPETALQLTRSWLGRWDCMRCRTTRTAHGAAHTCKTACTATVATQWVAGTSGTAAGLAAAALVCC
jgi:acetylornithine deacetylase/succinyl-diaminopimelate desuccinylase-like protein